MKVIYDPKHDLMNIEFLAGTPITESDEIDGIVFDYDKDRRIVAVEILDVSKRINSNPLEVIDFAVARVE